MTVKPPNSNAVLQNPTSPNPTFVTDVPGTYEVQLVVSDGQATSVADTVIIRTENRRPVANAGADQTATTGSTIQLNGSGSSDPDGDALTFAWSFVSTPPQSTAALNNPSSVSPSFIADVPGAYVVQLIVSDGQLDSVADSVTITVSPPDSSVLGCGSLVSGTITARGEVDLYSFTGQAGQIISLALASAGGFTSSPSSRSVALRLFAPSGALVGTLLSNSQSLFTLPAGGVYAVRVSANNLTTTGSYNISRECLFPVPSPEPTLPCGGFVSGTLGVPGATDLFTLTGQAGQIISLALASAGGFTSSPSSRSVALTIFSPSGAVVGATLLSNSQSLFTLPVTGVYAIRVSANNLAATGSYNISRECLFPLPGPEPTPLPCGGFVSGTLGVPGATDLLTLTAQAGQIISLALASAGGFTSSPSSRSVALTIFTPSGEVVGPTLLSNSQSLYTMPVTGVYAIRVSANNLAATGSYNISRECLFPLPSPEPTPLPCGGFVSGTLGNPGATDLLTLTAQAGQIISLALASAGGFTSSPSSRSVALTIFTPSGEVVGPTLLSNSQSLYTMPVTGVYAIRVSANNLAATGSYNISRECLFPLPGPEPTPLPCGGFVSGTLGDPGATDLLTLTAQAGQIISLALASAGGFTSSPSSRSVALTIFTPSGEVVGPTLLSNSQSVHDASYRRLRDSRQRQQPRDDRVVQHQSRMSLPGSESRCGAPAVRRARSRHDRGSGRHRFVHVHRAGGTDHLARDRQHGRVCLLAKQPQRRVDDVCTLGRRGRHNPGIEQPESVHAADQSACTRFASTRTISRQPAPTAYEEHVRRRYPVLLSRAPRPEESDALAARGATPSAFERRCIPSGCVASPSNIPDILGRRALPDGRIAALGATMDLHHGLLGSPSHLREDRLEPGVAVERMQIRDDPRPDDVAVPGFDSAFERFDRLVCAPEKSQ